MKRTKRFTPQLRNMMLGCFTAILLLLGLLIGKDVPQSEDTQAGTPATMAATESGRALRYGLRCGKLSFLGKDYLTLACALEDEQINHELCCRMTREAYYLFELSYSSRKQDTADTPCFLCLVFLRFFLPALRRGFGILTAGRHKTVCLFE